jgi:PAS domain S-box-containing protein
MTSGALRDDGPDDHLKLLEALEASAPIGQALVDLQWRYVRVNPALAAMNGLPAAEHIGRRIEEIVPTLWPQAEPELRSVVETGEARINRELMGAHPRGLGGRGTWLNSFYPVRIDGRLVGVGILVQDVTSHAQAEEQRAVIMQTMLEGVYTLDHAGAVSYMNAAAERLLGWTAEELYGRPHGIVHHLRTDGEPLPGDECPILGVLADGRAVDLTDGVFTRRDGETLPVSYSAAPLPGDAEARGAVVVFRDATQEHEKRLRAQRDIEEMAWVGRTRDALDDGRLVLYAQPIVPLNGGAPRDELLLRLVDRDGTVIPAGTFLPAAEKYGLIVEIDRWVIGEAVRLAAAGMTVQANVSAESTADNRLLHLIEHELTATGTDSARLLIELTETALMQDIARGEAFADGLAALGCGLVLDDFGTGFGSFTYLKRLPLHSLKIDMEFIRDLSETPSNQHVVQATVNLASGFGLQTIAEGVEQEETLGLLRDLGVDYAQGYLLGRPAAIEVAQRDPPARPDA